MSVFLHNMSREELVDSLIEVDVKNSDDFLKIRETLERVGIANRKTNTLYQSCHILHKRGKYYIVHFKELFALDGREVELSEDDIKRKNGIARLLNEWGLCDVKSDIGEPEFVRSLTIIPFKERNKWTLSPKYRIGNV